MAVIIDRRRNDRAKKSIANRQRFIKRSEDAIKQSIERSLKKKKITDIAKDGSTESIPIKDLNEPILAHSGRHGSHDYVVPGNDRYEVEDEIFKPDGEGDGPRDKPGDSASDDGDIEDTFRFTLSKEEFLDFFFADLELPNLVEKELRESKNYKLHRAGYTNNGSRANINIEESVKRSLGRRIALHRPTDEEIAELEEKLHCLRKDDEYEGVADFYTLEKELLDKIEELKRKQKRVPFIDDMDIKFNHFVPKPDPAQQAVMFCCMDVSASMGEFEKSIAKRFFMLLYLFLYRNYDKVDLVFIRHTHEADEVSEEEFFYGTHSGGTLVSSALQKMLEIIKERYPLDQWNIYGAQVSDGDNFGTDNILCKKLLEEELLPRCQYFAYIQVDTMNSGNSTQAANLFGISSSNLWGTYKTITDPSFAMKRVKEINEIWTVFQELFKKK